MALGFLYVFICFLSGVLFEKVYFDFFYVVQMSVDVSETFFNGFLLCGGEFLL